MLREAAEALGVSHGILRKFIKDDHQNLGPSKCVWFGKTKIYLYTPEDIEGIAKYLSERRTILDNDGPMQRRGRPTKWTEEEKNERQRKFSRAYYYKNKARKLLENGSTEEYLNALQKAEEIEKELKQP